MCYSYSFAFFASETYAENLSLRFYLLFFIVLVGIASLVIVQYEIGRLLSLCISGVILGVLYVLDFLILANVKQTNAFYTPLIIESITLGAGIFVMYFNIPERWAKRTKVISLYLNSHVIYAIIIVNVVYEMHNILYWTLKTNSQYLRAEEQDAWWKVENVYNTSK